MANDEEVITSDIEEDFHVLASSWPPLREFIAPTKRSKAGVGDGWRGRMIDWKDPRAVRELTKAQLHVRYAFILQLQCNLVSTPALYRRDVVCRLRLNVSIERGGVEIVFRHKNARENEKQRKGLTVSLVRMTSRRINVEMLLVTKL